MNKILLEILLAVALVVLLAATAHNTLKNARKMYKLESEVIDRNKHTPSKKESELTKISRSNRGEGTRKGKGGKGGIYDKMEEAASDNVDDNENGDNPLTFAATETHPNDDDEYEEGDEPSNERSSLLNVQEKKENKPTNVDKRLAKIIEDEKGVPLSKIMTLIIMFIVVLIVNILKGGGEFKPLGIQCGSKAFWSANVFIFVWIVSVSLYCRSQLLEKYRLKKEVGYRYVRKRGAKRRLLLPSRFAPCVFAVSFL